MKSHFAGLAEYNRWANERLYGMAATLPDEAYRKNVGAYFESLHGTLNHLLNADRIWLRRLTGTGDHVGTLNHIAYDDLKSLWDARKAEDDRLVELIRGLEAAALTRACAYRTLDGTARSQPLQDIFTHLFNHQTHHRGQAHTILTILGIAEPVPLDFLVMRWTQRA